MKTVRDRRAGNEGNGSRMRVRRVLKEEQFPYGGNEPHKRLVVWQRSIDFVTVVYALTRRLPKEEEFGLKAQLRRAAVSIPSNIAEGLTRRSVNDKVHFLNMAQGSLSEIDTQSIVCVRLGYVGLDVYKEMLPGIAELERLLAGLIRKLTG